MASLVLSVESLSAARSNPAAQLNVSSLQINAGEHVAVVGKVEATLLMRVIARLHEARAGRVRFESADITHWGGRKLRDLRRRLQWVGGNPATMLPPDEPVIVALTAGLQIQGLGSQAERRQQAQAMAAHLELSAELLTRPVRALLAGLRQRVRLAQALTLQPRLLVCDELTDYLDPALARPLLARFSTLCRAHNITWLWATRDEALAREFAERVEYLT